MFFIFYLSSSALKMSRLLVSFDDHVLKLRVPYKELLPI